MTAVERVRAYAQIAGTQAVGMDPAAVNDKAVYEPSSALGNGRQSLTRTVRGADCSVESP